MQDAVWTNIVYYRTNYVLIGLGFLIWAIARDFLMLLTLGLTFAAWFYVMSVRKEPFFIQKRPVSKRELMYALLIGSVFIAWLFGSILSIVWVAGMTSVVTLLHAALRHPNLKAKATRMATDAKASMSSRKDDRSSADDIEDPGSEEEGSAESASRGPVPGRVESRARRQEEYRARRAQLQNKYPTIGAAGDAAKNA